jgi:hypothetical protein
VQELNQAVARIDDGEQQDRQLERTPRSEASGQRNDRRSSRPHAHEQPTLKESLCVV